MEAVVNRVQLPELPTQKQKNKKEVKKVNKMKYYLYNCGADNMLAVNFKDYWIFIDVNAYGKIDGVDFDSENVKSEYASVLNKYERDGTRGNFYELACDKCGNSCAFCCYDPNENYVSGDDLLELIAEYDDDTNEADLKGFDWCDEHGQHVNFEIDEEDMEI